MSRDLLFFPLEAFAFWLSFIGDSRFGFWFTPTAFVFAVNFINLGFQNILPVPFTRFAEGCVFLFTVFYDLNGEMFVGMTW